jgi:hypothetical protein
MKAPGGSLAFIPGFLAISCVTYEKNRKIGAIVVTVSVLGEKLKSRLYGIRSRDFALWLDKGTGGVEALHTKNPDGAFILDEQTARDLDLAAYFSRFNTHLTTCGDQLFWHRLHSQPEHEEEIRNTLADVQHLREHPEGKDSLTRLLKKVGKQPRGNITHDLWDGLVYTPRYIKLVPYWFFSAPILTGLGFVFFGAQGLFGLLGLLLLNLLIFSLTNRKINYFAGSMSYLVHCLRFFTAVQKMTAKRSALDRFAPRWKPDKGLQKIQVSSILFKNGIGGPNSMDPLTLLLDYLRIFLCAELFAYYRVSRKIVSCRHDIRRIISWIGYLDVIVQSADLLQSSPGATIPEIVSQDEIRCTELRHPLVDDCVGQNLVISKSMVVTGMNMAGKSTFLKTIALNQILAVSLGIAFAASFQTDVYYVVTSLKIEDDIASKKSKYFLEAERLLAIQNMIRSRKLLCVIDEILTGTNTDDRIFASLGILRSLAAFPDSLIIAATHDIPIAEGSTQYVPCYFDGTIEDEQIRFDYTVKQGIVPKRNALALLQFLGLRLEGESDQA